MASRSTKTTSSSVASMHNSCQLSPSRVQANLNQNKIQISPKHARNQTSIGVTVIEKASLPVITEELMIEEGCDNELENNRQTIQDIRMSSKNHQKSSVSSNSKSNSGDQNKSVDHKSSTSQNLGSQQ